ncbi:MAG: HAD family hydrolase [Proteobacteria bacterium]|nr:HAD family hydrolase [Pseudomonadota bacterium]
MANTGSLRPELIVFDCDGVLVDSEPIANRVMAEAITGLGWPLSTADCIARFKGHHFDTVIAAVEDRLGRPVPEAWRRDLRAATGAAFERELRPIPGVIAALDAVEEAGLATCVASQGPLEKMAISLGVTGLRARFEGRIFSAYQVARGKPHPDLFLFAAEAMGVAPGTCVVIEDSPLGVTGAKAAGMAVLGFAPQGDGVELTAAGATLFRDMAALPVLLGLG